MMRRLSQDINPPMTVGESFSSTAGLVVIGAAVGTFGAAPIEAAVTAAVGFAILVASWWFGKSVRRRRETAAALAEVSDDDDDAVAPA